MDLDICATTTPSQQLSEVFQQGSKPNKGISVLSLYVQIFSSVFAKEDFNVLPDHYQWDHAINLIPRAKPKVYPLFLAEQLELDAFLSENPHTSQIYFSKSLIAALVFFIKKKNDSLQLVQDYRSLNAVMIKNKYLLPLISKLVSQLQEAKYFTKLDICWSFNNVCIKPRDKWKAVFCTSHSLFKPLVIFFGITNSLAIF